MLVLLWAAGPGDVARDLLFTALRGCRYLKDELTLEINFAACWRWFEAKLGSKIAPSWPQERPGSEAKSIFGGLEVELLLETIRPPTQDRVSDL